MTPRLLDKARPHASIWAYAGAVLACAATAAAALPFQQRFDLPNIIMLFVMTVVLVAVKAGRGPAVLAAVVAVALFDFLFVPPRFSFAVTDAQYLLTFAVMLAMSLIVGQLTAGLRAQAQEADRREQIVRALYDLARKLAGAMSVEQVDEALRGFLADQAGARCWLLLAPDAERLVPAGGCPVALDHLGLQTAQGVSRDQRPVMSSALDEPGRCRHFLPLNGATRNRGVLVVSVPDSAGEIQPLLEALASLVSTAVERLHFVEVAHGAQLEAMSERLRSSILSALSHDVRTPLTALYGMADSLAMSRASLPAEAADTALAIRDQALRVSDMVGKLLDMARLRSGRVSLRREWQPVEEVVGASLKLLGPALDGHPIVIIGLDVLPLLEFDAVLIERVLCNLFENAAKYSPPGSSIALEALARPAEVELRVCNAGEGFPPDRLDRVFDAFERGRPEGRVGGMGLGLAICRAIVEAHGGMIRAFNPPSGGACVAFTLPRGCPPSIEAETLPPEGEL